MTRTATGFCVAAALGLTVSVGAQTTTTTPQTTTDSRSMRSDKGAHEVTLIGCLARGADGNYTLNNARMNDAMSNRAATTTNPEPTTPTGTSGSTTTEPSATTTAGNSMSWTLEGGHDLDKHVGHKIEVTGHTEWNASSSASSTMPTATSTTTPHDRDTMAGPRLDVSSVKMISTSCQ